MEKKAAAGFKRERIGWEKITPALLVFSSVTFLIPNVIFIIQGFYSRHRADDFCFSGILKENGLFSGLLTFYSTTSNRFSAYIFSAFSEMLGQKAIRFISPLVIIGLGLVLFLAITRSLKAYSVERPRIIAFFLAQVILFFTVYLSPNRHQSVYWRSGLSHYFLPLVILCWLLYVLLSSQTLSKPKKRIQIVSVFLLSFFSAGLSESYAALQMGVMGTILLIMLAGEEFHLKMKIIVLVVVSLVGTLIAMVVMIFSPGNALRLDVLQQAPDVFTVVSLSFQSAYNFMLQSVRGLWLPFSTLFAISILIPFCFIPIVKKSNWKKKLILFLLIGPILSLLLIMAVCAPTAYGMMAFPEKRVLMLAQFILIIGVCGEGIILGWLMGTLLKRYQTIRIFGLFLFLIAVFYPVTTIGGHISELQFYRTRASQWGQQYNQIEDQLNLGSLALTVTALDSYAEIAEMRADPNFWVNYCTAQYYRVNTISAVEK